MTKRQHYRRNGLSAGQVAARIGIEIDVAIETLREIGITGKARYPSTDMTPLQHALRGVNFVSRTAVGKYNCTKCGAFCGLVHANGDRPYAPDCDEAECPAIEELG